MAHGICARLAPAKWDEPDNLPNMGPYPHPQRNKNQRINNGKSLGLLAVKARCKFLSLLSIRKYHTTLHVRPTADGDFGHLV